MDQCFVGLQCSTGHAGAVSALVSLMHIISFVLESTSYMKGTIVVYNTDIQMCFHQYEGQCLSIANAACLYATVGMGFKMGLRCTTP